MTMLSSPTFLKLPAATPDDLLGAPVAVLGVSEATPYDAMVRSHSADAPGAVRIASQQFAGQAKHHDFDLDRTLLPQGTPSKRLGVDLGDVVTGVDDAAGNRTRISQTVAAVLARGAKPLVFGGDDSVPIPVLQGFADAGPITVVQLDAHVDWGDEIRGERLGYGSPMRRASEMAHVTGMLQVGIRGLGSGKRWQVDDALAWGDRIVTAREWRRRGSAVVEERPAGERYVVSIDCDGINPAEFPAVAMPTPGGPGYDDVLELLHALAARGEIVGMIIAEYVPSRDDAHRRCAGIAARLGMVGMGLMMGGKNDLD